MENATEEDYMIGPTNELRIDLQLAFLSLLLCFGIFTNGCMLTLFARFKSLRTMANYLLADLTIVEFLDLLVNIPLFMEFFLLTKKKNLDRQTRWFAMLFHRFFLINDLFTQLSLSIDCLLAMFFGKRYTGKKTPDNVIGIIVMKWLTILALLLGFSIPNYKYDEETVSDEAYQRLLFGPSQIIWKAVIPSCQAAAVITLLMTNYLIIKSRSDVSKRYGMKVFGKASKNSSKAVNTLTLIMVVQTMCKVPAAVYSYVAVDDRVEGNRWFAFMSYFCLFLSSSIMPLIYFTRTSAFRRSIVQIRKHPFARNAYLDYAAHHGLTQHRNGRMFVIPLKKDRKTRKRMGNTATSPPSLDEQTRKTISSAPSICKTDDTLMTRASSAFSVLGTMESLQFDQFIDQYNRANDDRYRSRDPNTRIPFDEDNGENMPEFIREDNDKNCEDVGADESADEDEMKHKVHEYMGAADEGCTGASEKCDSVQTHSEDDEEQYCVTKLNVDVQMHCKGLTVHSDIGPTTPRNSTADTEDAPGDDSVPIYICNAFDHPNEAPSHELAGNPDSVPVRDFEEDRNDVPVDDTGSFVESDHVPSDDNVPMNGRGSFVVSDHVPSDDNVPAEDRAGDRSTSETVEGYDTHF